MKRGHMKRTAWLLLAAAALVLAALAAWYAWAQLRITEYPVPPRITSSPQFVAEESALTANIAVPLDELRAGLEADVPQTLWAIDRQVDECVPREDVEVLGRRVLRSPKIGCQLVGQVRRGAIHLEGRGATLVARIPVNAAVEARDVGGVIRRKTATASAVATLKARIGVDANWRLSPRIDIDYRWTNEPGIDLLGRRIRFTSAADTELADVLRDAERSLARRIRAIDIRSDVAALWQQGFSVQSINRENPPVWLRLIPQQAGTSALRFARSSASVDIMVKTLAELSVGARPVDPEVNPLGANEGVGTAPGFSVSVPVLADFSQLEPVILRALQRLAAKGVAQDDLGRLDIAFERVTLYATQGDRIAVGIAATIDPVGRRTGRLWGSTSGEIWLTGKVVTEANSQTLQVEELEVFGDMDTTMGDLLVRVVSSEGVRSEIESALVENFAADYERILSKARDGLSSIKLGQAGLSFEVDEIGHGPVYVTGDGLFMRVTAAGSASISIR